jgi:hypothetical protein
MEELFVAVFSAVNKARILAKVMVKVIERIWLQDHRCEVAPALERQEHLDKVEEFLRRDVDWIEVEQLIAWFVRKHLNARIRATP